MRDFDEILTILMQYRPQIQEYRLSVMVDYRSMVVNIDPVAALPKCTVTKTYKDPQALK